MDQRYQSILFVVDFLYGLMWFLMGWSILMRSPGRKRTTGSAPVPDSVQPFRRSLRFLAPFGLFTGLSAWIDMTVVVIHPHLSEAGILVLHATRLLLTGTAALCLLQAGLALFPPDRPKRRRWLLTGWIGLLAGFAGYGAWMRFDSRQWNLLLAHSDRFCRLFLVLPAALFVSAGLFRHGRELHDIPDSRIGAWACRAAAGFAVYGLVAGPLLALATDSAALDSPGRTIGLAARSLLAVLAAGLAIALICALEHLQKDESGRDAKTGLMTTPMIYRFIDACVQRGRTLSVLFIDIDHFKRINDRHGHLAGDTVLHRLAALLRSEMRSIDCVGRFGGEEFVIVLPDITAAMAASIAERLRIRVEQALFPLADRESCESLPVTVSIGVAGWQSGLAIEQLMARADAAMYRAKAMGRNRVSMFELPQGETQVALVRLEWHDQWDSGHAGIDAQHRQMLALGNELISLSLSEGRSHERLVRHLTRLVEHVACHFAFEEKVLLEMGYAGLAAHMEAHLSLTRTASAFLEQAHNGRILPQDCFSFMVNDVIVGHLLKADVDYFPQTRHAGAAETAAAPLANA